MKRFWSRLHFLIRFLGLTGLLAAGVGGVLGALHNLWPGVESAWRESWRALGSKAQTLLTEGAGDTVATFAVYLVAVGGAAALLALLVELVGGVFLAAGRRSAFGLNAALQCLLAVALLVGVNLYSFQHYRRLDWTRAAQFTLPEPVQDELRQLRGDTTVLVYLMHKSTGPLSDKVDAYEDAAARKVVEKVRDLVDQLREFGGHFRVEVLDRKEEDFDRRLAQLTADNPLLRDGIEAAPENSIFFAGQDRVQRLSFSEFYRLDKTASLEDNDKRGNLVLLNQGVRPFANRVLGIEEKRPRIGVAVVHERLTTEWPADIGLKGLKKSLTAYGFDVRDIMLKKWSRFAPPEPGVYTFDEFKFERLEEDLAGLEALIKNQEREIEDSLALIKLWESSTLDELTKKYARALAQAGVKRVTEDVRKRNLIGFKQTLAIERFELDQMRQARDVAAKEKSALNVDSTAELRRITDLKARLGRTLADCDLLIIPRLTLLDVVAEDRIPPQLYRLDDAQVDAIKEFLKAGKPVLACFGPTNEDAQGRFRPDPTDGDTDKLEQLLGELGIRFGKQTILFTTENKAFSEQRAGLLIPGANIELPPVSFDWMPGAGLPQQLVPTAAGTPNPIREGMRITARSTTRKLDLPIRHPRPVYFDPGAGAKPKVEAEFMMTDRDSWNEAKPFPSREYTPRYEPTKDDDPAKGTLDEERRGPFPIGVAVETAVPTAWYDKDDTKPTTVRVAAIGHGGVFTGIEMKPAAEQLLLHTCNWLLGRGDRLPSAESVTWKYPRVELDDREQQLWSLGTRLGLPVLFAYLGLVVLLVRRLR